MNARWLAAAWIGLFWSWTGPVNAQSSQDATDCFEARDYAACFRVGKASFKVEDYERARNAYLFGWGLKRDYELAGNLGNVNLELGNYAEAYVFLDWARRNLAPTAVEKYGPVLDDKLSEALEHVAAYRVHLTREDGVALAGATVKVDGAVVSYGDEDVSITPLPFPVALEPGKHQLTITKEGYQTLRYPITARRGGVQTLALQLIVADEPIPTSPVGNERPLGQPPAEPGRAEQAADTNEAGISALTWTSVGVASLGVAVGAVFGGLALSEGSSLEKVCGPDGSCPRETSEDLYRRTEAFAHMATAGFVLGGVGVTLMAIGLGFDLSSSDESESLGFRVGPGAAWLRGSF